ncbi:MAG: ShlB/FhaC/HecB family hemolysin secretion/activation protein [Methylococcaceae bacterium]|nr:MAG: ShlB/FhaC/HecB family hemolysin secretion/activation protein [Methylococcaceae bacterium]
MPANCLRIIAAWAWAAVCSSSAPALYRAAPAKRWCLPSMSDPGGGFKVMAENRQPIWSIGVGYAVRTSARPARPARSQALLGNAVREAPASRTNTGSRSFPGLVPNLEVGNQQSRQNPPNPRKRAACLGAMCWLLLPFAAWAADDGRPIDRPSARAAELPPYLPGDAAPAFTLPPLPEAQDGDATPLRQVYVERYAFTGNSVFDETTLQQIAAPYAGRRVSIDELEELRRRLTLHYVEHGYVNSGALIPEHSLHGGVLRFRIVEGRLAEVKVHGQGRLREGYIQQRLGAGEAAPLNMGQLQERFQGLLADPLIERMNGRLLPGAELGHSILDVDVTRARPYQLTAFGNNYRPPSIGAEAGGAHGWVRNLTGLGDLLDFTFQISAGAQRYSGGWSVPVSDSGTLAFVRFDEGDSAVVEAPSSDIDITSRIHNLEGGVSHPLLDSLRRRLTVGALFAVRENETMLLGRPFSFVPGETTGHSQATVLRVYQEHLERLGEQALALRSTFSVGLNALGATPQRDPHFPDSEFFAWLGQAQYAHRLFDNGAQLVWRGDVQLSNDPLLPLERIAVGGVGTVRGYRENQLVRDQGFSTSLEFHYPLYGGDSGARHTLTLLPFMDYGGAWNHHAQAEYLHSVGLGLNWHYEQWHAEFYWAHRINAPQLVQHGDLQDEGVHFQVKLDAF